MFIRLQVLFHCHGKDVMSAKPLSTALGCSSEMAELAMEKLVDDGLIKDDDKVAKWLNLLQGSILDAS